MIENFWANAAFSVTPTIVMGMIFWLVMRSILRARQAAPPLHVRRLRGTARRRALSCHVISLHEHRAARQLRPVSLHHSHDAQQFAPVNRPPLFRTCELQLLLQPLAVDPGELARAPSTGVGAGDSHDGADGQVVRLVTGVLRVTPVVGNTCDRPVMAKGLHEVQKAEENILQRRRFCQNRRGNGGVWSSHQEEQLDSRV